MSQFQICLMRVEVHILGDFFFFFNNNDVSSYIIKFEARFLNIGRCGM